MLKRVSFEEWQTIITLIAFFLCFLTFIYFTVRAVRMRKSDRDRLANLPLEDEESEKSRHE